MSYQIFIIQGNLTRDAEVRQVGQSTVASFGVATSRKFKKQDGTVAEETEFHDVELWNNNGVYQYLTKGASVLVQGEIKTDKWTDQNGQQRERKKVRASIIQLCGGGNRQQAQPQAPAQPVYPPAQPAYPPQAPVAPPQQQYQQPPMPPQAPVPPAQPQYRAPQPPTPPAQPQYQPPMPPQPGQPGNTAYPPMNDPAYTQQVQDDLPFSQSPGVRG